MNAPCFQRWKLVNCVLWISHTNAIRFPTTKARFIHCYPISHCFINISFSQPNVFTSAPSLYITVSRFSHSVTLYALYALKFSHSGPVFSANLLCTGFFRFEWFWRWPRHQVHRNVRVFFHSSRLSFNFNSILMRYNFDVVVVFHILIF